MSDRVRHEISRADAPGVFRRRTLAIVLAVGALSALTALILGLYGDELLETTSAGADSFSRSAVGHRAVVELLEDRGVPVVVSRSSSAARLGPGDALLLAEPVLDGEAEEEDAAELLGRAVDAGAEAIVVLPKWEVAPDPLAVGRARRVDLRPVADAQRALELLVGLTAAPLEEAIVRTAQPAQGAWESPWPDLAPDLPRPQLIAHGTEVLQPVVSNDDGLLVARHDSGVLVVSDPDLLNNAGLGRGDNAPIAHRLLAGRVGDGALVVDEVLHGFEYHPSLWAELAGFPLALVTLHVLGLLLLVVWSGVARFGRPEPAPPRVPPGKEALIAHTAELLTLAGHGGQGLRRYWDLSVRDAARACSLPPDLPRDERLRRLTRLSDARGLERPADLARRVGYAAGEAHDSRRIRTIAKDIHAWRTGLAAHRPTTGGR